MMKKIIAVSFLLGIAGGVYAAEFNDLAVNASALKALPVGGSADIEPAAKHAVSGGEIVIGQILSSYHIGTEDKPALDQIAAKFEITRRLADGFEVIVPKDRAEELLTLSPRARLLYEDIRQENAEYYDSRATGYHTFGTVAQALKDWSSKYPLIAKMETYGTSAQGNPLMVFKISDNVGTDENEPEILLAAATHGDEPITTEVVLGLMEKFLVGYETDERVKKIVDTYEIYFIPVVNPDGYSHKDRYDNGSDPNRSYPWPKNQAGSPTPAIVPLIKFFNSRDIKASIDFHASGELIMYPWAWTEKEPDDLPRFQEITRTMSSINKYRAGQISHIMYIAKGSSADYYYWKKKSLSLGIEMATSKVPNPKDIPRILQDNTESTLRFIEHIR